MSLRNEDRKALKKESCAFQSTDSKNDPAELRRRPSNNDHQSFKKSISGVFKF